MRILVVGGGGREHALVWRLSKDSVETGPREIICAPGNPGIARHAECVPISASDLALQARLAKERSVDLVVIGPEAPLVLGLADRLRAEGIPTFGPDAAAARLEGSKAFAKDLMIRAGIPTAAHRVYDDPAYARSFAKELEGRVALKLDGLAGGKGVFVCGDMDEVDSVLASLAESMSESGARERLIVEERLEGEEVSFLALSDGKRLVPLSAARDHKAVFDADLGPNTGGMGAFSPTRLVSEETESSLLTRVMQPAVDLLREQGAPFVGVLYAGLMFTRDGPKVLEFNVRFGDPETQPLMMRLSGDLGSALLAAARGDLSSVDLGWDPRSAVCVVLASHGYPAGFPTGLVITEEGLGPRDDVMTFHAGTKRDDGGKLVTSGGRVLGVTALGDTLTDARNRAYEVVERIRFEGAHFRRDIAAREVISS